MSKVSVIIPVYNAKDYLRRCLDSVCNQTLQDIEIICVNDCSTDNSLEILQDYAQKDTRIKIIDCKKNGGESIARNIGIDKAKGEFLAFVDNDDVVDLDFYEKLYQEAEKTGADIVKGEAKEVYYDGKSFIVSSNKKIRQFNYKTFFKDCWWTAIYKRNLIIKNTIRLPEQVPLGGDILFLTNAVIAANKVATVDGTYYNHIQRKDSGDSLFLPFEKLESALTVFIKIIKIINDANIDTLEPESYDDIFQNYTLGVFSRGFRNNDLECKHFCAKTTFEIYTLCKRKQELDNCIMRQQFDFLIPLFHNNDIDGMTAILVNYLNFDQLRISMLRKKIKRNLSAAKG